MEAVSIFYFLVLIFSIIVHEVAHGLAAEREGDPTARVLGRITLNPLKHIDLLGSVIIPAVLILSGTGIVFGWAKPVPYNPDNVRRGRKSVALISIAGIIVNLGLALIFGLGIRLMISLGYVSGAVIQISSIIVLVNVMLALFNAMPFAPLDGFRFLSSVLPRRFDPVIRFLEQYSLPLLLLFMFFGWKVIAPFAFTIYTLLTGIAV